MKRSFIWLLMAALLPLPAVSQDWQLVWADEFEGDGLDTSKWSYMTGDGTDYGLPSGWGNNELQYYREENVTVTGGNLVITAKRESYSGKGYTSGRIRTMGKGEWTYGRIEFRAKMPLGKGFWAAIWMLPTEEAYGGWAASGEIDIMEYLGHDPSVVYGTLHYGGQWPNNRSTGTSYTTDLSPFGHEFHDFALEWEEGAFRWYVDGHLYQTQTSGWYSSAGPFPAPFNREFHLLINLAVGGNWPGAPDGTTQFPQQMLVDYIRVYQAGGTGVRVTPSTGNTQVSLEQNYPNPFRATTVINYELQEEEEISLGLYDALGRRIRILEEGVRQPGRHTCQLDGSDLPNGLYYYRLETRWGSRVRRMTRL
jgi:beta-glucanase (GH16 family)